MTRALAALFLLLALAGCGRSMLFSELFGGVVEVVEIDGGTLSVHAADCPSVDLGELVRSANDGISAMRESWPGRELYVGDVPVSGGEIDAYGYTQGQGQRVLFRCGVERVLRHEMFHTLCFRNDLGCCERIDHDLNLDCSGR